MNIAKIRGNRQAKQHSPESYSTVNKQLMIIQERLIYKSQFIIITLI